MSADVRLVLGPPEVLWLDSPDFEHWTGRTPRTILRDFQPAGLAVYERDRRRYVLHSEYIAFLKATSTRRKELSSDDRTDHQPEYAARFRRDERGRIAAVAGARR